MRASLRSLRTLLAIPAVTAAAAATTVLALPSAPAGAAGWPAPRVAPGPYAVPSSAQLDALARCEASGNYRINTGNGFYGAFQFDLSTWRSLGMPGRPDAAPPAVQRAAASRLETRRGWQPWPGCARKLGLVAARVSARVAPAGRAVAVLGQLSPARAGDVLYAQRKAGGTWHNVAVTRVSRTGSFRAVAPTSTRGALVLRVYSRAASGKATSAPLVVHVS
jgi:hypothetical protein